MHLDIVLLHRMLSLQNQGHRETVLLSSLSRAEVTQPIKETDDETPTLSTSCSSLWGETLCFTAGLPLSPGPSHGVLGLAAPYWTPFFCLYLHNSQTCQVPWLSVWFTNFWSSPIPQTHYIGRNCCWMRRSNLIIFLWCIHFFKHYVLCDHNDQGIVLYIGIIPTGNMGVMPNLLLWCGERERQFASK